MLSHTTKACGMKLLRIFRIELLKMSNFSLKELRNISGNYFCVCRKIFVNTSNILDCYFSNQISTLTHQTKYLHVCRKLNLLLVNSTYLIVPALLKQRRLIQTKVHFKSCYSVRIEAAHKPSKVAAAKKLFSSVYVINAICFNECFLFHVVTGRHYF